MEAIDRLITYLNKQFPDLTFSYIETKEGKLSWELTAKTKPEIKSINGFIVEKGTVIHLNKIYFNTFWDDQVIFESCLEQMFEFNKLFQSLHDRKTITED